MCSMSGAQLLSSVAASRKNLSPVGFRRGPFGSAPDLAAIRLPPRALQGLQNREERSVRRRRAPEPDIRNGAPLRVRLQVVAVADAGRLQDHARQLQPFAFSFQPRKMRESCFPSSWRGLPAPSCHVAVSMSAAISLGPFFSSEALLWFTVCICWCIWSKAVSNLRSRVLALDVVSSSITMRNACSWFHQDCFLLR